MPHFQMRLGFFNEKEPVPGSPVRELPGKQGGGIARQDHELTLNNFHHNRHAYKNLKNHQ